MRPALAGNQGKHHAGAQGVFHSRMSSARADNDDNFVVAYLGLSRPGSGSVTRGSDLRPALASRDDASSEQSGLHLARERRQPVRQPKFQDRLQGLYLSEQKAGHPRIAPPKTAPRPNRRL